MRARPRSALRRIPAAAAGLCAAGFGALLCLAFPDATVSRWREAAADAVLLQLGPAPQGPVVVIDIDEDSLRHVGPWPWPRERLAELVSVVASGIPLAIGIDILLEGPDRSSPVTLAGRLAEETGDEALAERIRTLPDPDAALAVAISSAPVVLASLAGGTATSVPAAPILVKGAPPSLAPWGAPGVSLPHGPLAQEAVAVGSASLEADPDGLVRRVPLLVAVGSTPNAGLAAETLRAAESAAGFILSTETETIGIGRYSVPLVPTADIRFRPSGPQTWAARTISAAALLDGRVTSAGLEGRIVLLGGSAPALGGLRATAAGPLVPSVQIQADAISSVMAGSVPVRPPSAPLGEAAAAAGLALAGSALGAAVGPTAALAATLGLSFLWAAGAVMALVKGFIVIDPIGPALAGLAGVLTAGGAAAVTTRRTAARLRRRFEQHLSPAVVARLAERPDLVKLDGERREVTALFTDIEGFTAVTDRIGPEALVRLLDGYFEGVVAIIVDHGGMIDKIVGDAVHALFNAPVALEDHPRRAVEAALAIAVFSDRFRTEPEAAAAGLGRTRIGIETGEVVVGDVGAGSKLDYTAHGSAVNTAARLEAANKTLGSTICVGPICRSRVTGIAFRDLGTIEVRGRGAMAVHEPVATPTP